MHMVEQRFRMSMHDMGDQDAEATLRLRLEDGGAGEYLVVTAHEWAVERESEIDAIAEAMRQMLARAKE